MGTKKHLDKIEQLFTKSPVVNFNSIRRIVGSDYAKQLVRNLIKQKKIFVIGKGYYTNREEVSLAVYVFKPAYLGLQDAMSFHQLWEQETIPVIITSTKAKPGIREVMRSNVLLRRINKKYLFGYEYYDVGGVVLPYSDIEKTMIDLVYFGENMALVEKCAKKVDIKKLNIYLKRYPDSFKRKVLSFL